MDEKSLSQPQPQAQPWPVAYPGQDWLPPKKVPPPWIYVPPRYYTPTPHLPQPGQRALADFGVRFAAAVIDIVALGLLAASGIMLITEVVSAETAERTWFLWPLLLFFCYSPIPTALWGASGGKLMMGLSVARVADGSRLSYGRALWRHLVHAALTYPLILILLNSVSSTWDKPLRQCWHDKAARTVVVRQAPAVPTAAG